MIIQLLVDIYLPYFFLLGWLIFSIYSLVKYKETNPNYFQIIPTVFTTIGVFGTFLGIAAGLYKFDTGNINDSITPLLDGMKVAFMTSILGIFLSLIFSNLIVHFRKKIDDEVPPKPTSELTALQELITIINDSNKSNNTLFNNLTNEIKKANNKNQELLTTLITSTVDGNSNISNNISTLTKQETEHFKVLSLNTKENHKAIIGKFENSEIVGNNILTAVKIIRDDNKAASNQMNEKLGVVVNNMNKNSKLIQNKFDEFSDLLAKNNTEALVEAMQRVITDFNAKMNDLIQRLVKENFQELNNSVKRLNTWQIENKKQVATLIEQFNKTTANIEATSRSVDSILKNTKALTDENSHLKTLIGELQKVMIDDKKFTQITDKVVNTIDTLKKTTEEFDNTTNALNQWVRQEKNIKTAVKQLIVKLQELEKIKSYNEEFWQGTKRQMEEGIGIIKQANNKLAGDVKNIDSAFYQRLNTTLSSLDQLIQQFILNSKRR
ncbi:MAG: MotA/TolQ/ExbB proton channel family protein [Saprospiraceae bacterium]